MVLRGKVFGVLSVGALAMGAAQAQTFDFEGQAEGFTGSISDTQGGMTVTATSSNGVTVFDLSNQLPTFGDRSLVGGPFPWEPLRLSFSTGVTGFAIDAADGSQLDDDGNVVMQVFDSGNNLLDTSSIFLGASTGVLTFSYSGSAAAYAVFSSGGRIPNSVAYDNLRIRSTAVPGPAAVLPFALGLLARRRRRG